MPKQIIQPVGLPDPSKTRAYSHGVRTGNLLFLAGQTGHDAAPASGVGRFEAQTRRLFEHVRLILEARMPHSVADCLISYSAASPSLGLT